MRPAIELADLRWSYATELERARPTCASKPGGAGTWGARGRAPAALGSSQQPRAGDLRREAGAPACGLTAGVERPVRRGCRTVCPQRKPTVRHEQRTKIAGRPTHFMCAETEGPGAGGGHDILQWGSSSLDQLGPAQLIARRCRSWRSRQASSRVTAVPRRRRGPRTCFTAGERPATCHQRGFAGRHPSANCH